MAMNEIHEEESNGGEISKLMSDLIEEKFKQLSADSTGEVFPGIFASLIPLDNDEGEEDLEICTIGYISAEQRADWAWSESTRELPDQITIFRPLNDGTGDQRISISSTMLHLTQDNYLCCRAIDNTRVRTFVLFSDETGKIGKGVEAISYAEACDAIKERNQKWNVRVPPELLNLCGESLRPKPKGRIEPRFSDNDAIVVLPNTGADRDLHRSFMVYPHQWLIDENLCLRAFDGKENTVVYQPSEVTELLQDAPEKALVMLEKRFGEIKNETVPDVIDILFHHWHRHHDPNTNATIITAAQLCKYRKKGAKGDNLDLHWHALQDAFSMSLRERAGSLNAKVFFSEIVGEKLGSGAAYVYSPGFMLQYALRGETLYFAPFMQKIWELDPIRHKEAKRIARYIRGDWRMNTEKYLTSGTGGPRAACHHTWAHILSESGIDVESHRESKDPGRLIRAVEKAIETLYQMEVLDESGLNIYHPHDRSQAENLPTKGRLNAWLALKVCLAPAADVREALVEIDSKRRAGRARDAKALATERARNQIRAQSRHKSHKI